MVARGGGIEELTAVTLPTDRRKGGMDKRHEGGCIAMWTDGGWDGSTWHVAFDSARRQNGSRARVADRSEGASGSDLA
jgi:hypothetical protein